MPVVKGYEETVAPRALPGVRQESVATPALMSGAFDSGARLSEGLSAAGTGLSAVAFKLQEREDVDAIYRAETKLKEDYLAFDADVKKNRRGTFAKGVADETKAWWDGTARKHLETLKNDNQRRLFINRTSALRLQSLGASGNYEREQTEIAHEQSYKANKVAEVNIAANDPTDANVVAAKDNIERMNRERAAAKGWTSDFLKGVNDEDITRLHDQVIERLVAQNPDQAKAYYDRYKGEITSSETKSKLEKLAAHADATTRSVRAADEIFKTVGPAGGVDVMTAEARKQFAREPELMKLVIAGIKDRVNEYSHGQKTRMNELASPLNAAAMSGVTPEALRRMPQFAQLLASGVDGEEAAAKIIAQAQREQQHRANMALTNENRAYTAERRRELRLNDAGRTVMLELTDPTKLAAMTRPQVENLYKDIGVANTQQLLDKWDSITKSGTHLQEAKLDDDAFKSFARRAGLDPLSKNENSKQAIIDTRNRVERLIIVEQTKKKQPLTRVEKDTIMERELKNTITQGWIFKSESPAITLDPEKVIPRGDYRRIEADIRADGRHAPTPDNVMRVWQNEQNKNKKPKASPEGNF